MHAHSSHAQMRPRRPRRSTDGRNPRAQAQRHPRSSAHRLGRQKRRPSAASRATSPPKRRVWSVLCACSCSSRPNYRSGRLVGQVTIARAVFRGPVLVESGRVLVNAGIGRMSALGARMVCNMGASLYEPINVYKLVAPNIGIVDGPFEYLTVGGAKLPLPFTTRMTVVRLSNGDLFLHSPIKCDVRLASELLGLGAVRRLVSPNQFHYAHIGEWKKAFPNAVSWASPRVRERVRARHVDAEFTRDLEVSPPEEWRREIDQTLFPGGYFKEFIFFHRASKTLILADTIINIELD